MGYKTKITGIYQIQSISHPNRVYIGSALNLFWRWSKHHSEESHIKMKMAWILRRERMGLPPKKEVEKRY